LHEAYAILRPASTTNAQQAAFGGASDWLDQIMSGGNYDETEASKNLHGIVSGAIQHHLAIGETGIFPLAAFTAIAE